MSKSLNRVTLIGNVGSDPEVRSTTSGSRVATISVATSQSWTGQNGEKQESTQWHRCVAWNRKGGSGLADIIEKYVSKGDRIYVDGEIEYRQWQDKENQTRYTTEIKVRDIIMLGGTKDGVTAKATAEKPPAPGKKGAAGGDFEDFPAALEDTDDDLPF